MRLKASFSAIAGLAVLSSAEINFDRILMPHTVTSSAVPAIAGNSCRSSTELIEQTQYYDFFGARAADADRSLRQRLLVSQDYAGRTKRFTGQADWQIEWRPCLRPVGATCRIDGVASTVKVTYTVPRWADRDLAADDLGRTWDNYAIHLLNHEKGHGQIAFQVAKMMDRELTGLVSVSGCESLKTMANAAVGRIMRRGESMQNEYDRRTGHGSLQGARFPF